MRTFGFFLLAAAFPATFSQNLNWNCSFLSRHGYTCLFENVSIPNLFENFTIGGDHLTGKSDADVTTIIIRNSTTPFIVPQIFEIFKNISMLQIESSGLSSIDIPDAVHLNRLLYIIGNNIQIIQNGTFRNQANMSEMYLRRSGIEVIEEDAFQGLLNLNSLQLDGNRIRHLSPRTFFPLTKLALLTLGGNFLNRIDSELFSRNIKLSNVYLEDNEINELHPRFADNLRDPNKWSYINLKNNTCVDSAFTLRSISAWEVLDKALETCFNNFAETAPEKRRITMEFVGHLTLFDESDHVIVKV